MKQAQNLATMKVTAAAVIDESTAVAAVAVAAVAAVAVAAAAAAAVSAVRVLVAGVFGQIVVCACVAVVLAVRLSLLIGCLTRCRRI